MSELWREKTVRSRKQHECTTCLLPIPSGVEYVRVFWRYDSDHGQDKQHIECKELRHSYCTSYIWEDNPSCANVRDFVNEDEWNAHVEMIRNKYQREEKVT